MTSPWNTLHNPLGLNREGGLVTLVDGRSFSLSSRGGDMVTEPQGLFVLDTRVISRWALLIDGEPLESLAVSTSEPYEGIFAGRCLPGEGQADGSTVVFRRRSIGMGMREQIEIRNHGTTEVNLAVALHADADFAGLFDVKDGRMTGLTRPAAQHSPDEMRFIASVPAGEQTRETVVRFSQPAQTTVGWAGWKAEIPAGETWVLDISVDALIDGAVLDFAAPTQGAADEAVSARRMAQWRASMPHVTTDMHGMGKAIDQAGEDLGALRIFDSEFPDIPVVAAGAPWFMTLFGRDSLLTSWMALPAGPELAMGVLASLARFQGSKVDDISEEEPGKILHEMRFGSASTDALRHGEPYYGTVDATPLWVMLLAEAWRWGADEDEVRALLPNADRAMEWLRDYGDRDGDGFVEYHRRNPDGLANQGWKDSWDGVLFSDGELALSPMALCEAQAYAYGAHIARADLADGFGEPEVAAHHRSEAAQLKQRFNEVFWIEERGFYALALDKDKRPVDAISSNLGHCLWTGIVDDDRAASIADHLAGELFSGFGIRTLGTSMSAYNPVSYHNGSVWPHDTSICVAGLARYGFDAEARKVTEGLLELTQANGGRFPELFAGFDKSDLDVPAVYPASCVPQAWSAAAPMLLLRVLLGLTPDAQKGQIQVRPILGDGVDELRVDGIWAAGKRLSITVNAEGVTVDGTDGLTVVS
jgi:glycogen debranching enzyme